MTKAVSLNNGPHILDSKPVFVIDGKAYRPVQCKYCSANIAMVKTVKGRMQPRNADGTVHFATCAQYPKRKRGKKKSPQMRLIEDK